MSRGRCCEIHFGKTIFHPKPNLSLHAACSLLIAHAGTWCPILYTFGWEVELIEKKTEKSGANKKKKMWNLHATEAVIPAEDFTTSSICHVVMQQSVRESARLTNALLELSRCAH